MMRHLSVLVLTGALGVLVLAGDAEACHRRRCRQATCQTCVQPAPCPQPVVCPQPTPCRQQRVCHQPAPCRQQRVCAPRAKRCGGGGLFARFGHKNRKSCAPQPCAAPVAYAYAAPVAPCPQGVCPAPYAAPQAAPYAAPQQ